MASISPAELLPPLSKRRFAISWRKVASATGVLIALIGAMHVATRVKLQTPTELMNNALAYRDKGDRAAAAIELKSVLQADPDHLAARMMHGTLMLENGDIVGAEDDFKKAQELGAKREVIMPFLARALLARKEYQMALDTAAAPPGEDPANDLPALIALRGHALFLLGRHDQARESYQLALKADPDQSDALLNQAWIAVIDDNLELARNSVERAVAKDPRNADALALMGDLKRLNHDVLGALAAYEKAVEAAPNNHEMRLGLASLYVLGKSYDKASHHLNHVIRAGLKSANAFFIAALIEFRHEKFENARNLAEKGLYIQSNHIPSLLTLGASGYATRDYTVAEKALRRALVLLPEYPFARKLLGASLVRLNRPREAIDELLPMVKRAPKDHALLATLGEAYLALNDYHHATEYLEQAAALAPEDPTTRIRLGRARLASHHLDQATADFEAAYTLSPQGSEAKIMLAVTHIRRKDFDRALTIISEMGPHRRKDPVLFNVLGGAYLGKSDVKAAAASFDRALEIAPGFVPAILNLVQIDLRANDPRAATRRLREFLRVNPNNMQAMLALAAALATLPNESKEAENWLERAHQAHPDSSEPLIRLARYRLSQGMVKAALFSADLALQRKVESPALLDELGLIQMQAGATRGALDTYIRMAAENPSLALAHYRLGIVQEKTHGSAAARISFRKALDLQPDYLEAKIPLAKLEASAGKLSSGLQLSEEIQKQFPKSALGRELKGDVLANSKRMAEAIPEYEAAYATQKSAQLALKLHQTYASIGNIERGESFVATWLRDNPDDRATRQSVADYSMSVGRFRVASEHYERLAKALPKNQQVANNLAVAYDNLKHPRAFEVAERAYQLDPRNPYAADTYAWMLVRLGQAERGRDILKEAVAQAPSIPDMRYHYAVALAKSGQRKEARDELASLRGKVSDEGDAKRLLAELKN